MREWIEISVPILAGGLPCWPGSTPFQVRERLRISRGDSCDDSEVSMSIHTGTHIDAPSHFVAGAPTVEHVSLDALNGVCEVISYDGDGNIAADWLEANVQSPAGRRLLFRTSNSWNWSPEFQEDFIGFTVDGAVWLAKNSVKLVGIDYLSVQPYGESDDVHRALLSAAVPVLEGLILKDAPAGIYNLYCLPLRLEGLEGAPARALLRPHREEP